MAGNMFSLLVGLHVQKSKPSSQSWVNNQHFSLFYHVTICAKKSCRETELLPSLLICVTIVAGHAIFYLKVQGYYMPMLQSDADTSKYIAHRMRLQQKVLSLLICNWRPIRGKNHKQHTRAPRKKIYINVQRAIKILRFHQVPRIATQKWVS